MILGSFVYNACINQGPSQYDSCSLFPRRSGRVKRAPPMQLQSAAVIATPVVATAVSLVTSPVDSASVRRPKQLERRSACAILPSCDVHVTFAKIQMYP